MIKAEVIMVEAKSRMGSEKMLGEAFNKWMEENGSPEIVKFFEPVRKDNLYGDWNYNTYHTSMTFFYRIPNGLKELEKGVETKAQRAARLND